MIPEVPSFLLKHRGAERKTGSQVKGCSRTGQ
jgi:hypothetical protein